VTCCSPTCTKLLLRRFDRITDELVSLCWLRVPERIVFKVTVHRPVSDSPTVFSLARRQISLAFLAERAEREKRVWPALSRGVHHLLPLKKILQDADCLLFGVVYVGPTYFLINFIGHANSTRRHNKACLFIVVFIAIFNKISPYFVQYRLCAIAVNRWCMAIQKTVFFQGRDTEREVTVERVLRVYILSQARQLEGLGESSPGGVWGAAPAANYFWTSCAILRVYALCKDYP